MVLRHSFLKTPVYLLLKQTILETHQKCLIHTLLLFLITTIFQVNYL